MSQNLILLLRPHHYIKNVFIVFPLFFALKINELPLLFNTIIAFVAFSSVASAVYIFNDYQDIESDRLHPHKKNRPLASGTISPRQAFQLMFILLIFGLMLMSYLSFATVAILLAYIVMNIAYSLYLKHIAILDIVTIAVGFVLRLFVGSGVTQIPLSQWIVIMTFLLALFMALAKRRDDVMIFTTTGKKMRKVIDGYNLPFLDTAMSIMASVVIVVYIIYTTSTDIAEKFHSQYLYLTAIFVILGIMRYLQLVFVLQEGGSPTRIMLHDRFMQWTIVGWLLSFVWILY